MKQISLSRTLKGSYTVILADGEFPDTDNANKILSEASRIICCDGAADTLINKSFIPYAIVGDCDSISSKNKKLYQDRLIIEPDQNYNDLTKAVRFAIGCGFVNLVILGATGKREDHSIANVSLLCEYSRMCNNICMITNYGVFHPLYKQEATFSSYYGEQVSVFCISKSNLTTKGLEFSVENYSFEGWWQTSLNKSMGDSFYIKIEGKGLVFQLF